MEFYQRINEYGKENGVNRLKYAWPENSNSYDPASNEIVDVSFGFGYFEESLRKDGLLHFVYVTGSPQGYEIIHNGTIYEIDARRLFEDNPNLANEARIVVPKSYISIRVNKLPVDPLNEVLEGEPGFKDEPKPLLIEQLNTIAKNQEKILKNQKKIYAKLNNLKFIVHE